jgi:hypothetical protein
MKFTKINLNLEPGEVSHGFTNIPGFPAPNDPEVAKLMETASRMTRPQLEECLRSHLRGAVGYGRTGDVRHLTVLAHDALFMQRLRLSPEFPWEAYDNNPAPGEGIPATGTWLRELGL